ncbi:MAG: RHS repeat-associated core domain-containing protein, partial [Flavobacterium sp.]
YTYDLNGNMTTDQNKGIINAITYNHLNLPTKITLPGGVITYVYNALGQKVSKTVNTTNTNPQSTSVTEYLGGYQYNNNVLQFFPTAEGYVKNTVVNGANSYDYIFNYTDHLGNIRLSYGIAPSTHLLTIFEENNYYPFGLKHETYNYQLKGIVNLKDETSLDATPFDAKVAKTIVLGDVAKNQATVPNSGYQYKYQGQERQDELGLNWDSFKWRNYDYAIGRFMSIDPLAEKYSYQSPYNFSENRVVDSRELEGLEAVKSIDGNVVNVTVRVRPENCSSPQAPITNEQMQTAMGNFVSQSNQSYTGKNAEGQQVNFNFINDPQGTLTAEFTDIVSYPEGYASPEATREMSQAGGAVLRSDFGNTQTGNMQISTQNSFPQAGDTPAESSAKRPGSVIKHEVGHVFGLEHVKRDGNNSNATNERNVKNVMFDQAAGHPKESVEITPEQRTQILNNIPTVAP